MAEHRAIADPSAALEAERISCRQCGMPRALDAACTGCGAAAPDERERNRLLAHRDRMRRALQRLQSLAVRLALESNPWEKAARAIAFLLVLGFFGGFMVLIALSEGLGRSGLLAGCAIFVTAGPLAAWLLLKLAWIFEARGRQQAYEETDPLVETLRQSYAARCPGCGACATLLRFDDAAHPCPWCDATLVTSEEMRRGEALTVSREVESREAEVRQLLERALERSEGDETAAGPGMSSFKSRVHRGANLWSSLVGHDATLVKRIELDIETPLRRALYFCEPEAQQRFDSLARAWRAHLPEIHVDTVDVGPRQWHVYSDTKGALEAGGPLALLPYDLPEGTCLLLDRAGASLWSHGLETVEIDVDRVFDLLDELRG